MALEKLDAKRVACAKRAYTTRRVNPDAMASLITGPAIAPASGDLVLVKVDEIGKQRRIELTDGRRAHLFPGDEAIVCFGNRYAPDQFEGVIGEDLSSCDLVAAGGIASCEITRNERMIPSTRITPLGLVGDAQGRRLNLRDFAVDASGPVPPIPIVLSLGTSMNAGKTFTSTSLVRGLKAAGHRVAAIKATGTGAGNDLWIVRDAGADVVLDFTDGGLASTYLIPLEEIVAATRRLIRSAAKAGCDVAVVEVADGLQHLETADVIQAKDLWEDCVGVVFAAYDSMGAKCGVDTLRAAGHNVLAISGRLTQSPLMIRETARSTGLPVYTPWEIQDGALTPLIMSSANAGNRLNGYQCRVEITADHGTSISNTNEMNILAGGQVPALTAIASGSDGGIRELLKILADKVMAAEVSQVCGAGLRKRCSTRTNRRSGYRLQNWETGLGRIELKVPKVRKGGYHPLFLRQDKIPAQELALLVARAAASDATPRDLEKLLERIGTLRASSEAIANWSSEVKQEALNMRLDLSHISTVYPFHRAPSGADRQRRTIREEYGVIAGYGDDYAEMDPFVRVETMPIRPAGSVSGYRKG
ncbi:transposase [Microvirga makkahensis]|uniref:Mutator family transposase n=1 Tax=Microvirga makkahensis TaxID=1128670 RepID=A0A7X3MWD1_9HYPH|nr:transposase [Microvirga makkahensis]MXQ14263.1 hypothetical protein [Microvirga makkahensis]